MSFPTSPIEGQIHNKYKYTNGMWDIWNGVISYSSRDLSLPTAGTRVDFQDLSTLESGSYACEISWSNIKNSAGTIVVWQTTASFMLPTMGAALVYNAAPTETIIMNYQSHHKTYDLPTFTMDSDDTMGDYGNMHIYVTLPYVGSITTISFRANKVV